MELGLIGKSLSHSFSKAYFEAKFERLGLDYRYSNYELAQIDDFPKLLSQKNFRGFNVTIPYKEAILPFVDWQSEAVRQIGACNTLVYRQGRWEAHNTDYLGFTASLQNSAWRANQKRALILGTGGAAKAVHFALEKLGFTVNLVSRKDQEGVLKYSQAQSLISHYDLLVNTTPLGTYPLVEELAPLRPEGRLEGKLFYDLIYNPEKTAWLKLAEARGAQIMNGLSMLELQAEASFEIWTAN